MGLKVILLKAKDFTPKVKFKYILINDNFLPLKYENEINMNDFTSRNLFSNITLLKNKQFRENQHFLCDEDTHL